MAAGWRSPFFLGLAGAGSATPPPTVAWTLGALWVLSQTCAKQGLWGMQRTGDGITPDSDVTSTHSIDVVPGQILFTSMFARASAGTDGTVGFGFAFYSSVGTLLSSSFITTSSFPATFTQFSGNITVPNSAATAVPIIRATGHLAGTWCVDAVYAVLSGGNFVLAGLRHWYSDYTLYR